MTLALVTVASGLGTACGVKGPLYFPPDPENQKDKETKKDEEKTSRADAAPRSTAIG
jgi:predicted small lipoprotein YifL